MPGRRWDPRLGKLSRCEKCFKCLILSDIYVRVTLLPMHSSFVSYVQHTEILLYFSVRYKLQAWNTWEMRTKCYTDVYDKWGFWNASFYMESAWSGFYWHSIFKNLFSIGQYSVNMNILTLNIGPFSPPPQVVNSLKSALFCINFIN
jgi:hypothetical protein